MTWQHDCLEGEIVDLYFLCLRIGKPCCQSSCCRHRQSPFEKQISNLCLQSELRFIAPVRTGQFTPYNMSRGLISQITDNTFVGVQSLLRWSAHLSLIQGCLDDWLLHSMTERQNVTAAEPWNTISLSLLQKLMPTTACYNISKDKTNQCEHINESLVILIMLDNWGLIISSHSIETCYLENGDHLYWWWQTEHLIHDTYPGSLTWNAAVLMCHLELCISCFDVSNSAVNKAFYKVSSYFCSSHFEPLAARESINYCSYFQLYTKDRLGPTDFTDRT